jgi:hypothetical protein
MASDSATTILLDKGGTLYKICNTHSLKDLSNHIISILVTQETSAETTEQYKYIADVVYTIQFFFAISNN